MVEVLIFALRPCFGAAGMWNYLNSERACDHRNLQIICRGLYSEASVNDATHGLVVITAAWYMGN